MLVQSTSIESIPINTNYSKAKRILDVTFTILIAPFVLFVGGIVAICIKLNSPGPIFYRQKRIGQDGIEFEMLKFRSMYINNDSNVHREKIIKYMNGEKLNEDGNDAMAYKHLHDPRITSVGRFIRKTSIDELPQFWNVLCGQMSLVGPRPPLPYEVECYSPHDCLRLTGKPGLTGPWQVYGRSRVTFHNMVNMDITYLKEQSLWYDLKLVMLTIPVMIFGRGGA
ncbi:multidrug MFS transporter [Reticulibacter mediterranei]|uniref:Multidrug MFS transporter n=1 Tax=Reticulibacter mediterranei TaxID=2778369 RepID=A0A8J3N0X6_9CHLR|nr:sugar transferase [Reticulibacter mediterranei]GHO91690.1 multidrug MFS transporter [Reticulibacter mediterranei]